MAKVGRKLTLDSYKTSKIVKAMHAGLPLTRAAEAASVTYSTLSNWMRKGRKDHEAGRKSEFQQFFVRVKAASAEAELKQAEMIIKTAKKTWTAAAWYLERRHPERWGRRDVPPPPPKPAEGLPQGERTALPSPAELLQKLVEVMGRENVLQIINAQQKLITHSNGQHKKQGDGNGKVQGEEEE